MSSIETAHVVLPAGPLLVMRLEWRGRVSAAAFLVPGAEGEAQAIGMGPGTMDEVLGRAIRWARSLDEATPRRPQRITVWGWDIDTDDEPTDQVAPPEVTQRSDSRRVGDALGTVGVVVLALMLLSTILGVGT